MILSGRYGAVLYGEDTGTPPITPVEIISLNQWKASFATEYEDVTCFGDVNRVYVPGLPDISGTVGGFWNSEELALFKAATATKPGMLKLIPNNDEPTFYWQGLAYLDASIDASLKAPKVTGNFRAAGPWTGPDQGVELSETDRNHLARARGERLKGEPVMPERFGERHDAGDPAAAR